MGYPFSVFIVLNDTSEVESIKTFVKEYYSVLDCINENVDSSSNDHSVCVESISIGFFDDSEVTQISDSIFTGAFVMELAKQNFNIQSMSMIIEGICIAAADFDTDYIDYCAVPECDEEFLPVIQITGSAKDGFEKKALPYSQSMSSRVNERYFKVMEATY